MAATLLVTESAAGGGCGRLQFEPFDPSGDAASGTDATDGLGDGQTGCAGASYLFCDDLEDPSLAAWPSQFGVVQHTTSRAHTGTGSLLASSDGVLGGSATVAPLSAVTSGELHARGWFYVPSNFDILKFNLFQLAGDGPGALAVVDQGDLNAYLGVAGAETIYTTVAMPLDRWVCIGLDLVVADVGGSFAISIDGTQVGSVSNVDTLSPGGYEDVTAGMPYAAPGQEMGTVFVDDVAVDTQPIPCN